MQRIPQTDGSQSSRLIHGEQDTLSAAAGLASGGTMSLWMFLLNALAILLTIPNHLFFCNYLWKFEQGESDFVLILFTPLNLVSVLVSTLEAVRVQAVCGVVFACIQFYTGRRIQRRGMQIL